MKGYTATLPSGEAISYVDRKRRLWILSVVFPLMPFVGICLHWTQGDELLLLVPLLINYIAVPLTDMLLGEDLNNSPSSMSVRERSGQRITPGKRNNFPFRIN